MLRILIIYLISYCCFSGFAAAQPIPPSSQPVKHTVLTHKQTSLPQNFAVVDSLMAWTVADLNNALISPEELELRIAAHPADWLLESHILDTYQQTRWLKATDKNTAADYDEAVKTEDHSQLHVNIRNCGVQLFNHPQSGDSLLRRVEVSFSARTVGPFGLMSNLGTITHEYSDVLARTDLPYIQNTPHSFALATIPEEERGFFDEVIEPLVVAGALVVTVVLLFTVRSQ